MNRCDRSAHGELSPDVADLVNGLTAKHMINRNLSAVTWARQRYWHAPRLSKLKHLRLISYYGQKRPTLYMSFRHAETPCLEMLEIERHGSLAVSIDPALALDVLVLIAAVSMNLCQWDASRHPLPIAKHMYFKSGAAILHTDKLALEATDAPEPWARLKLSQIFSEPEGQNTWARQLPAFKVATWESVVAGPALSVLPKPVCQSFVIKHGHARVLRSTLGANALEDLDS